MNILLQEKGRELICWEVIMVERFSVGIFDGFCLQGKIESGRDDKMREFSRRLWWDFLCVFYV